jgi:hypothetical protein
MLGGADALGNAPIETVSAFPSRARIRRLFVDEITAVRDWHRPLHVLCTSYTWSCIPVAASGERSPRFALACSGLVDSYVMRSSLGSRDCDITVSQAKGALAKALHDGPVAPLLRICCSNVIFPSPRMDLERLSSDLTVL